MIFTIPRYFEFDIVFDKSVQRYLLLHSNLALNSLYVLYYRIIGSLLFYSAIPYLIILVLSLQIWYSNMKAHEERQQISTNMKKHFKSSERLFITIVAKFLLSRSLTSVLDIIEFLIGSSEFVKSNELLLLSQISNLIIIFSSAINFCIFYKFSSNFRSSFIYFSILIDERTSEWIKSASQSHLHLWKRKESETESRPRSATWSPGDRNRINKNLV